MAYEVVFDETGYQPTSGTVYVIQREIKQLIATHEQLFKRKVPEDFRITYRIFKTQEEFKQHATANGGTVHDSLGGYARRTATLRQAGGRRSPRTGAEVVTWKHELPAMHLAVLLHETTHAVTFAVLRNAPLWVLEGGAGWLGRPAWANDLNAERKLMSRWLIHSLERGELPALRVFLETETYQDWDKLFANERSKGYVLSYSLFQYFMSRPDLQAFFTTVLTARDVEFGGQPAKALAANLDKLWAGRLPAIEKGWHNWIRQRAKAEKEPSVKGK